MCIIIDANVASELTCSPVHVDAKPILDSLFGRETQLAVGGHLIQELAQTRFRRLLREFVRSGVAKIYSATDIINNEEKLKKSNTCVSDDIHIIALAQTSGSRLVYTRDKKLHQDIKNKGLLDRPRGKVYCSHTHSELLKSCPRCR